jgi:phospholipase/carboxylesterase
MSQNKNSSKPVQKKYGHLDCIEIEGDGANAKLTVVMLHGFGADCSDLVSLARTVAAPPGTRWIFPNAHLTVPLGPHMEGRAWFPISLRDLESSMSGGAPLDFANVIPPGIKAARQKVVGLMQAADLKPEKTCIAGFSQGAMLATDLALSSDGMFAGLGIISGTLVCREQWIERAKLRPGLRYYQSHGVADQVLPVAAAERLWSEVLAVNGLKGQFFKHRGGHEIPLEVCAGFSAFLFTLL